jgi:hypothetical protein
MNNVSFVEITDPISGDVVTHAIIDRGNGEFTSMLKSIYDAQQAALVNSEDE